MEQNEDMDCEHDPFLEFVLDEEKYPMHLPRVDRAPAELCIHGNECSRQKVVGRNTHVTSK